MRNSLSGRALAGLAAVVLAGASGIAAAAPAPADFMAMSKAQYQRFVQAGRSAQGAQRAMVGQTAPLDTTGPVISRLDLPATLDAGRAGAQIVYSYTAADNLSGVRWLGIVLTGPQGQELTSYTEVGLPRTQVTGRAALFPGIWIKSGDWRVTEVRGQDQANNHFQVPADLNALGNVVVRVSGGRPEDTLAPTLVSGKVTTPRVSLSTPPKGVEFGGPLVGLSLVTADTGAAGMNHAYVELCASSGSCIYLNATTNGVLGVRQITLQPFTVADGVVDMPGVYELASVSLSDYAGNTRTYTSVLFGGDTDFSTLFPTTTIELVP